MSKIKTFKSLFRRNRRPGDIVFAWIFLVFSVFLLTQIGSQTQWANGQKLFAQPRFWPAVSLAFMTLFAVLHLIGSALSQRIEGRWREVSLWGASAEYAIWFTLYAAAVPFVGFLPMTVIFVCSLLARCGYRSARVFVFGALAAVVTVILFKSLLQVKIPSGELYEYLPDGFRQIMLTYF